MTSNTDQALNTLCQNTSTYLRDSNNNIISTTKGSIASKTLGDCFNGNYDPNISPDTTKTPNMTTRENNQYGNTDMMYELVRQISYLNTKFDGIETALNNINTNIKDISAKIYTAGGENNIVYRLTEVKDNLSGVASNVSGIRSLNDNMNNILNNWNGDADGNCRVDVRQVNGVEVYNVSNGMKVYTG
jgi:hypothetical protein